MKKILITMVTLFAMMNLSAQVEVYLNNGEIIKGLKLKPKLNGNLNIIMDNKASKEIKREELNFFIRKNKEIGAFSVKNPRKLVQAKMFANMPPIDLKSDCTMGAVDAVKNYDPFGPFVGTAVTSVLAWPVGLVTAIVVSSKPPRESKLSYPDLKKVEIKEYKDCYNKEAFKVKKSNTWMGWALGTSLGIMVSTVLIAAL
jgi:hypothetical protein